MINIFPGSQKKFYFISMIKGKYVFDSQNALKAFCESKKL